MGLTQWAIYDHPKDHPENFVVRRWFMAKDGPIPDQRYALADSIEAARELIPPGFVRMAPFPSDDPVIAEVWI